MFFWSTAQNHNGDSLQNELKEHRKVGQKASKISSRKPFVAPNQSESFNESVVGSGGLSSGGVTNKELCSQDDEQRWPVPQLSL